ncbi:Panacea domain-containing protein [Cronobacter muytjensii]|uniref:Panacea domain-containing protein n=1 Tax=Cronobacter muytjensii TaxID=413501 RepID=UPI002DB85D31|nr:Panacea domain-containing protein [Cronobacter muytjensii]MEB8638637.1 Panacea domain-containing protein [Cronobacter muytjensii]
MLQNRFDPEKALEAILYVASKAPISDIYHVGKILYFADCAHLERYGRFILGDNYVAMKDGPVASKTYDMMKLARGDGTVVPKGCDAHDIQKAVGFEGQLLKPKRQFDEDAFSDSDIACIDAAIEKYGRLSFKQIRDISHDEAWKAVDLNKDMPLELIAQHCANSELLLSYLRSEG